MSKISEELEMELNFYFSKEDELGRQDRRALLNAILQKHLLMNGSEINLSYFDLSKIRGDTISSYVGNRLNLRMDKKDLSEAEAVHLLLLENFIQLLDSKNAFKRMPKFNKE
jgi:hypothetical protein